MGLAYHSTNALILEREHVSQLEKQMASVKEELKKAQATLNQETQKTETIVKADESAAQNLQNLMQMQIVKVNAARNALEEARAGLRGKDAGSLKDSIQKQKQLVDQLKRQLNGIQSGESQTNKQLQSATQQKKTQESIDLAQIERQIAYQQGVITQTNANIFALRGQKDPASKQQLQELSAQLGEQKQLYSQLQAERGNVKQYWSAQIKSAPADIQGKQDDLKESAAEIKRNLDIQEGRLKQLQQQNQSLSSAAQSNERDVQALTAAFNAEQTKLDGIKQELDAEQARTK